MQNEAFIETDVLVIGGGLAGCWAALRAKDFTPAVTLVDKSVVARSGGAVFCHNILAPMNEGGKDECLREVVEHAEYMSDQKYAQIVLEEEANRIKDLESWGVPFERDQRGKLLLTVGRGHRVTKIVLCDCRRLMEVMRERLQQKGVRLVERVMVVDLLTSDGQHPTSGRVVGAVGINTRTGQYTVFKARAVILATGAVGLKAHASFADNTTGDAQAMAWRAGAKLGDLEFAFGGNFSCPHGKGLIVTSLIPFQTLGAHIINRLGERFMEKYAPEKKERSSTLGLLMQAAAKEIMEGQGPIFFDMRHFSPEQFAQLRRVSPTRFVPFDEAGIDPSKELVKCLPLALCFIRGVIDIGLGGESSVPGLLAAGVAARFPGWSVGLSGAALAVCNVFGYRAGEYAAKVAAEGTVEIDFKQVESLKNILYAPLRREPGLRPMDIYRRLHRKLLKPEYTLVKSEETIKEMLIEIQNGIHEDLPRVHAPDVHELIKANEARNFLTILEPMFLASRERRETRLTHCRKDYPFRDDRDWLKWVLLRKLSSGVSISYEPVPVATNQIRPPVRERLPAPVQFG